jgi:hypothetical protein
MILSIKFLLFIETIVKFGEGMKAEETIGYRRKRYQVPKFWKIFRRNF